MKHSNITTGFCTALVACNLLFISACNQNSSNHDANTYSNGNPVTDSSASYNNSNNNQNNGNDDKGISDRPTTASDTMQNTNGTVSPR